MRTEAQIAADDKRRGSLTGSLFIVPVVLALTILMLWVLVCILLTPGAEPDSVYGSMQRATRFGLIISGVVVDLVGLVALMFRLSFPSDAV